METRQVRYSAEYLAKIKNNYDLRELIGQTVTLTPKGERAFGTCPFHSENTPSFCVSAQKYYCFGCHKGGDAIAWLMQTQGKTFGEAVRHLARGETDNYLASARLDLAPKFSRLETEGKMEVVWTNNELQHHYVANLKTMDSVARDYIYGRLTESQVWKWGLGYGGEWIVNPRQLEKAYITAGVLAEGSNGYYHRFRDRLTIPLRDKMGRILGFQGRLIPRPEHSKKNPKYTFPPTTPALKIKRYIFGLDRLEPNPSRIIVVEGFMDCIQSHENGVRNVVAAGSCHLSVEQMLHLSHISPEVVIMFDSDKAGLTGAVHMLRLAPDANCRLFAALLPAGLDPDEWIKLPGSSFSELPLIPSDALFQDRIYMAEMKDYDFTLMNELLRPYVIDNIRSGLAHYNVVDWVMRAYPQYAEEFKVALRALASTAVTLPNGRLGFTKEAIAGFLKVWRKPCKEVRLHHGEIQS